MLVNKNFQFNVISKWALSMIFFSLRANFDNKICLNKKKNANIASRKTKIAKEKKEKATKIKNTLTAKP